MHLLFSHAVGLLGFALAVLATVHMLAQRRTPQSTSAWLVAMFAFPWVGVPLYLTFGGRKLRALMESKHDLELPEPAAAHAPLDTFEATLRALDLPATTEGNTFELHEDGAAAFAALITLLDGAHERVDYATFIFADDAVGRAVMARLVAKASAGVKVRLLLDAVGCLGLSESVLAPLRAAGGEIARFMPVLHHPLRGRTNLRNHRKIVIVDDTVVWTGGRNTAADYMTTSAAEPAWIDLSCTVEGRATAVFREVFDSDWRFARGQRPDTRVVSDREAPERARVAHRVEHDGGTREGSFVQVCPSGPDMPGDALFAALVSSAYAARSRVLLVTPYFVPPEALTDALALAARRGVDVRLVMPEHSNHTLADWAREPHLAALAEAGVRVRLHPRMVHAKCAVFDEEVALVGSANLDERSLLLNFEIVTAVHGGPGVEDVARWIVAHERTCQDWSRAGGRARRTLESLAETVAPLL